MSMLEQNILNSPCHLARMHASVRHVHILLSCPFVIGTEPFPLKMHESRATGSETACSLFLHYKTILDARAVTLLDNEQSDSLSYT